MESIIEGNPQQKPLDFWKEFVDEVNVRIDELKRRLAKSTDPAVECSALVETPSHTYQYHQCAITLDRISTKLGSERCQWCFYYTPGTEVIRVCAWEDRETFISLHTAPQGILADLKGRSMTARQLASFVVAEMFERVKFPE